MVRNRFTVTITDIHGSKHYLLHQIIKRFILYFSFFVIFLIVSGSFFISLLMQEVNDLEGKKVQFAKEQIALIQSNEALQSQIKEKTEEFDAIKDKVSDIEELVGIKSSLEEQINVRLENISFNTTQQKLFFSNIPSGDVVQNKGTSGNFGWRIHPILKTKEFHRGMDLRADIMTPVSAPADGVVEFAGFHKSSGFGNLVIIDHNFGFKTSYAHLSSKFPFKAGEFVKKGDIIAYTGSSGLSTGPHLHYELRFVTRPLDPKNFTQWNSNNFEEIFKKEKRVPWQSLIKTINAQFQAQKQPS